MVTKSLLTLVQEAGIGPHDPLDLDTVVKIMRHEGLNSAYSGIESLEEFNEIRHEVLGDTQTYQEFQNIRIRKIISLQHDYLGVLLQTMNFNGDEPSLYSFSGMVETEENEKLRKKLKRKKPRFEKKYNIDLNKVGFFAQGIGKDELEMFVGNWHSAQSGENKWNPEFAPVQEDLTKVYEVCKRSTPKQIINWFSFSATPTYKVDIRDEFCSIVETRKGLNYIIFPFDGWTLARCFQLSYQNSRDSRKL